MSLRSVKLPDTITYIGSRAFAECAYLESISIPPSVITIRESAFEGCKSLRSASLPGSICEVAPSLFSRCESLRSVSIPPSVTSIGRGAFKGCCSLKSLAVPKPVREIEPYLLSECNSLESIDIPDSVESIGDHAFLNCASLKEASLPRSLETIEEWSFSGCESLKHVHVPDSTSRIGPYAFCGCKNLESATIESSTVVFDGSPENRAFEGCESLKTVTVSKYLDLTAVPAHTFPPGCKIRRKRMGVRIKRKRSYHVGGILWAAHLAIMAAMVLLAFQMEDGSWGDMDYVFAVLVFGAVPLTLSALTYAGSGILGAVPAFFLAIILFIPCVSVLLGNTTEPSPMPRLVLAMFADSLVLIGMWFHRLS